jgi:phage baseplate assembly protein V
MWRDVEKRIDRALSGVRQAFRGVLKLVNSRADVQLVQLDGLAGEPLQDAELFQHFGFTSNPPDGTMTVVLPVGGKTSHSIIVATEHGNYRLKSLKPGEMAIYSDEGANVTIKKGRIVEANCDIYRVNCKTYQVNATDKADFVTPEVAASAVLTVEGQTNSNGGLSAKGGEGVRLQCDVRQESGGFIQTGGGGFSTDADMVAGGKSLRHHRHPETGSVTNEPA